MNGIDILTNIMYAAVIVVSILLICLVLVQPSKSGGMGAAFGGIGQSVFGAQASGHLTKLTVILTTVFFVLALSLAFLIGLRAKNDANLGTQLEAVATSHTQAEEEENTTPVESAPEVVETAVETGK